EQAAAPDVAAVVRVAEMVRLIPGGAEVELVEHLAVPGGLGVHVDDGEEVVVPGVGVHAEDVEVLLGAVEAPDEGGLAGCGRARPVSARGPAGRRTGRAAAPPRGEKTIGAWVRTPEVRGLRANGSLSRQPRFTVLLPPADVRPDASLSARRTEVRPPGLDRPG